MLTSLVSIVVGAPGETVRICPEPQADSRVTRSAANGMTSRVGAKNFARKRDSSDNGIVVNFDLISVISRAYYNQDGIGVS